jgi:hypothetical protein
MIAVLLGGLRCGMALVGGFMARAARAIFATVRAGLAATCARLGLMVLRRCLRITTGGVNKASHTESQSKSENFDSVHLYVSWLKKRVIGFANERFIDALCPHSFLNQKDATAKMGASPVRHLQPVCRKLS